MSKFDNLDLIVRDVGAAVDFFEKVVGLPARVVDENFAELESGEVTIMLSPAAMVPVRQAAGVILHFQVDNVRQARQRAYDHGVAILMEPTLTDWGTESLLIAGPEEMVIDLYRWVSPHYSA
ncbi:MAG: VOC family protein [Anaerolineae bacterium]|uniref:VOC family protein n=1 Tax=Promineifilum sp. TaxID=2664178 RepID=UPI001DE32D1D|nr:VOC family protein [Anaerolineales bacterium]MCB8935494.1 VOC family protein [Promineifilum sp.]MCO5180547.1 VOC family protein [Promineifilum sp.]MCW5847254.1 VOC family protein [Anaerolineae bacterium]